MTNYTQQYQSGDVGKVSIDLIVGIGATLVGFVAIVGLIMLYRMASGKKVVRT